MEKIPTAETFFLNTYFSDSISDDDKRLWLECNRQAKESVQIMIEFAKLHVEQALKEASGKLYDTYHTVCEDGTTKGVFRTQQEALNLANHLNETTDLYHDWNRVVRLGGGMSKDTILNSYPLTNIK